VALSRGHTDITGSRRCNNQWLSSRRATAVRALLIDQHGIRASPRISAVGARPKPVLCGITLRSKAVRLNRRGRPGALDSSGRLVAGPVKKIQNRAAFLPISESPAIASRAFFVLPLAKPRDLEGVFARMPRISPSSTTGCGCLPEPVCQKLCTSTSLSKMLADSRPSPPSFSPRSPVRKFHLLYESICPMGPLSPPGSKLSR